MMNNETKRDVFDDALRALEEFGEQGSSWEMAYDDLSARYSAASDAALPDDLPAIPKCISEEIRDAYGKSSLLDELAWAIQDALPSSKVSEWINDNEDLFAEAWSRGIWVVEETGEVTSYDD